MTPRNIEEKIVFALSQTKDGPMLVLGVPKAAWDYMSDGKTHHFDLTKMGFPVQLMLFGGENHDACMKVLQQAAAQKGVPLLDERNKDHGIKGL